MHRPVRTRTRLAFAWLFLAMTMLLSHSRAQEPMPKATAPAKPAPEKGTALRLPDGTIVFYTKNSPDDPAPKVDGVVLSARDYQQLLEQAEQARKGKDPGKPVAPTACHAHVKFDTRNERPVANLRLSYNYRTTVPRQLVLLGAQRAIPISAFSALQKSLPILESTPDGWAVLAEHPGSHVLILDLQVAVTTRGPKGEIGFELSLPHAAITTLMVDRPRADVSRLTLVTRAPDPSGVPRMQRTVEDIRRYAANPTTGFGAPLGPVDSIELLWEPLVSSSTRVDVATSVDTEVNVRIDDTQIETQTRMRLRGGAREWKVVLPEKAQVTLSRPKPSAPKTTEGTEAEPILQRVGDTSPAVWKFTTTDSNEWILNSTVRQPRSDAKEEAAGVSAVGPYYVTGIEQQSGQIRIFAPVGIQVTGYRHPREILRLDTPTTGEEIPVSLFRYVTLPDWKDSPQALLEFQTRRAEGSVLVQPKHTLKLGPSGWRLQTEFRITPIRRIVDQISLQLPAGWKDPIFQPLELVDEVEGGKDANVARTMMVRLAAGRKEPFTLVLECHYPLPSESREANLPLPRITDVLERQARVQVEVPSGLEVRGSARETNAPDAVSPPLELKSSAAPGSPTLRITAESEGMIARVDLGWNAHRPELTAELSARITITEKQADIVQQIQLKAQEPITRPIRLTGPDNAVGVQASPFSLEPAGRPGDWVITPPLNAKEIHFTLHYAIPLQFKNGENGLSKIALPLYWPDSSRTDARVRIWTSEAGARRPVDFEGAWRERLPEPVEDRDSLPWLTVESSVVGESTKLGIPLSVTWQEAADLAPPLVERTAIQSWLGDDSLQMRSRFLLKRWTSNGLTLEIASSTPPTVYMDRIRTEVTLLTTGETPDYKLYHVKLPESGLKRQSIALEVRTSLPASFGYEHTLYPPLIKNALYRSVTWWYVGTSTGTIPLVRSTIANEARWRFRELKMVPSPALSSSEMDRWFNEGLEPENGTPGEWYEGWPNNGTEGITFRQYRLAEIRIIRLPRLLWVLTCSLLFVLVSLLLFVLRGRLLHLSVLTLAFLALAGTMLYPQIAGQVVSAIQPGIWALLLLVLLNGGRHWWHRRRMSRLNGFVRSSASASAASGPKNESAQRSRPTVEPAPEGSRSAPLTSGSVR